MTTVLMTPAEYAAHRGVKSRSAVSNWKRAGLIVFAEDPSTGAHKIDVRRSDAKLNAKLDPLRGRPASGPAPTLPLEPAPAAPASAVDGSFQAERIEQIKEQRFGQALKNAQSARELGAMVELERRANAMGRAARERMHAWFRGSAERLAAERDVRAVMMIGEDGIDQVFSELAEAAADGAFAAEEAEDDAGIGEEPEDAAADAAP